MNNEKTEKDYLIQAEEYQQIVDKLEDELRDESTPQGRAARIKDLLYMYKRSIDDCKALAYKAKYNMDYYMSDDYIGARIGKFHFYFGYESSRCPVKSHRTADDCWQKNCEKREWIFEVENGKKTIFEIPESDLEFSKEHGIQEKFTIGLLQFIDHLNKKP